MSGFDTQMRSQEMVFPLRQRGAELQAQATASLGQIPREAMQLAQQKAESDAKIQAWAIERQLNVQKLQEMQALDQAGMSRLQVEAARHQNDLLAEQSRAARQQNDRAAKMDQALPADQEAQFHIAELKRHAYGTVEENFAKGLVMDEKTGIPRPPKNDAELKATADRLKRIANLKDRGYVGQGAIAAAHASMVSLQKELEGEDKTIQELRSFKNPTATDTATLNEAVGRRREITDALQKLRENMDAIFREYGVTSGSPGSAVPQAPDDFLKDAFRELQQYRSGK